MLPVDSSRPVTMAEVVAMLDAGVRWAEPQTPADRPTLVDAAGHRCRLRHHGRQYYLDPVRDLRSLGLNDP